MYTWRKHMNGASINKLDRVGTWFDHKLNNILCNNIVNCSWWLSLLWTNLAKRESSNCLHQILAKPSHHLERNFILPTSKGFELRWRRSGVVKEEEFGDFLEDLVLDSQVVRTWTQCTWPVSALLRSGMLTLCLAVETPHCHWHRRGWRSAMIGCWSLREKGLQSTDEQECTYLCHIVVKNGNVTYL